MPRIIVSKPRPQPVAAQIPSNRTVTSPQDTEGKLFRVRDAKTQKVWGSGLAHADAVAMKNRLVGSRQSRAAIVEPEPQPQSTIGEADAQVPAEEAIEAGTHIAIEASATSFTITVAGVVDRVADGHELLVNGEMRPTPTHVSIGDVVFARPLDPVLAQAQEQARAAVRKSLEEQKQRKPKRYMDVTVRKPVPRSAPPPPDVTVDPVRFIRLGAPPVAPPDVLPSPLKVATIADGDPMPDGVIGEEDIKDLAVDIGGGPSDDDVDHAKRVRDAEGPQHRGTDFDGNPL